PVRMDQELIRLDHLLGTGLRDQFTGKGGKLPVGHHPPHYIAAVDVEDHVEIKVGPLYRPLELRDVPAPRFVGRSCKDLRLCILGTGYLPSPLFQLTLFFKDPVHGAHRTEIALLVEKGRVDFPGRLVDETIGVKDIEHVIPFLEGEGQRREPARRFFLMWMLPPVKARTGYVEGVAGRADTHFVGKRRGDVHDFSSLLPLSSSATFFWTSIMSSACLSLCASFSFSRSSSVIRRTWGSAFCAAGPLFLGMRPWVT